MQLTAKLIQVLQLQTGTGKNGQWQKQDIVVETTDQYPKKVCVAIWGNKIDPKQLQVNSMLKIDFDVESREFNGKWYTDVKAWKIEAADSNQMAPPPAFDSVSDFADPFPPMPKDDDLPF